MSLPYLSYLTASCLARKPSAIRALLPLTKLPGMISLAGGMPNPETFPITRLAFDVKAPVPGQPDQTMELTSEELNTALQYSATPGIPVLLDELRSMQMKEHSPPEQAASLMSISVTTGSQDALAKAFAMLVGPEDTLLVENTTYSGSLAFLRPLGCNLAGVETDGDGLIPDALATMLESWDKQHPSTAKPRVLYTIPTGANPTGGSLSLERKRQVYEIARRHELIIMEDDPYYFMQFSDKRTPSFFSMDEDARVLRFDSFSKILSSGLRMGMVTGPAPLVERINLHTQATNLHPSGLPQMMVYRLLKGWREQGDGEGLERHLRFVCDFYRKQRDAFLVAADRHLQGLAEWNVPQAGMFVWIRLLGVHDSFELITTGAVAEKVLLVPGNAFAIDGAAPSPFVRAAFSTATPEEMDQALQRLAVLLRKTRKEGGM